MRRRRIYVHVSPPNAIVIDTLQTTSGPPTLRMQVLHFVLFHCAWFAAVLGAARQWVWLGCLCIGVMAIWHLTLATRPALEAKLIACALLVGTLFETLNVQLGYLRATSGQLSPALPAPWLIAMWGLLALTLNVSLRWLKSRLWLAGVVGAFAGPVAYAAGAKLDALVLLEPRAAVVSLGLGWAVLLPLLVWLSIRFDGVVRHD